MQKTLLVFGTRPEAIKLFPLILELRRFPADFDVKVCVTGQHRGLLDQVLTAFDISPDYDLNIMTPGQSLFQSTTRILSALEPVLAASNPDLVVVQGDTTTTMCGALAAFYRRIPVAHVEAGLRTGDVAQPFPEEMNRLLATRLAQWHFAPTAAAAGNLRCEAVPEDRIHVTGNTGVDALLYVQQKLASGELAVPKLPGLDPTRKTILVTGHRRESFGDGFFRICRALSQLAQRADVQIVYPVHPNPNVRQVVEQQLAGQPNTHLIEPLDYIPFVDLMNRSFFILTDSGGVQEEAPSLGKPVLVLRENTERPEAVIAGTTRLVGTDVETIIRESSLLLDSTSEYQKRSHLHNPYGDGHACERIRTTLARSPSR